MFVDLLILNRRMRGLWWWWCHLAILAANSTIVIETCKGN